MAHANACRGVLALVVLLSGCDPIVRYRVAHPPAPASPGDREDWATYRLAEGRLQYGLRCYWFAGRFHVVSRIEHSFDGPLAWTFTRAEIEDVVGLRYAPVRLADTTRGEALPIIDPRGRESQGVVPAGTVQIIEQSFPMEFEPRPAEFLRPRPSHRWRQVRYVNRGLLAGGTNVPFLATCAVVD